MKLGRNDPCHCGSGKKYKYCHYDEDRAAEANALKEAAEARAAEAKAAEAESSEEPDAGDTRRNDAGTRPHKRDGSRFIRDSSRGGHGQKGATGTSPRAGRGAQRGG